MPKKRKAKSRSWLGILLLSIPALALLYNFMLDQPSIEYVSITLDQPIRPESPILVRGTLRNYGRGTARNYRLRTMISSGVSNERPVKPDFDIGVDPYGQAFSPSVHDLAPGQDDSFVPGGRRWALDNAAYEQLIAGKRKVLFYTEVHYQDLLYFPHTKVICHKIDPKIQNTLARCTTEDTF